MGNLKNPLLSLDSQPLCSRHSQLLVGKKLEQPEVVTKLRELARGLPVKSKMAAERSPPVGPLRFSEPQPPEPWKGVRDATSYPPMCLQDKVTGQFFSDVITNRKEKVLLQMSEDCLYLNIYTPVSTEKQEKLPVFVWIHGGGLVFGAASSYDGSALAAFENVVVVAIQYRLGILGYFSTGDKHARGNWGYLDQVAALQWIQENIIHFGGDPGSVTIFGESAGGISVSALILSPLARGLFHRAISESGTVVRTLFTEKSEEEAQRIAAASGCEKSSSAALVECLREKTEEEMEQITVKMHPMFISSTVDGVFFPKSPKQLLSEKAINAVPYIIGVNNHEFGWVVPEMMKFPDFTHGLDKEVARQVLQSSFVLSFKDIPSDIVDLVFNEYMGKAQTRAQVRDGLLDAIGDHVFVFPAIEVARYHRDAGHPVYFYEFQHRPSSTTAPEFVKADHGDEIFFVFGMLLLAGDGFTLSFFLIVYRNPNGEGLAEQPSYRLNEKRLEINLKRRKDRKLKEKKVDFWEKVLFEKPTRKRMENKRVTIEL
uniref:Carboxylic ester hydrolase n=1 Tax=Coturnix japonica TaxID=93934 RepID=A0A8C2YDB0_COTJA